MWGAFFFGDDLILFLIILKMKNSNLFAIFFNRLTYHLNNNRFDYIQNWGELRQVCEEIFYIQINSLIRLLNLR